MNGLWWLTEDENEGGSVSFNWLKCLAHEGTASVLFTSQFCLL
jgi:hypothetical protein